MLRHLLLAAVIGAGSFAAGGARADGPCQGGSLPAGVAYQVCLLHDTKTEDQYDWEYGCGSNRGDDSSDTDTLAGGELVLGGGASQTTRDGSNDITADCTAGSMTFVRDEHGSESHRETLINAGLAGVDQQSFSQSDSERDQARCSCGTAQSSDDSERQSGNSTTVYVGVLRVGQSDVEGEGAYAYQDTGPPFSDGGSSASGASSYRQQCTCATAGAGPVAVVAGQTTWSYSGWSTYQDPNTNSSSSYADSGETTGVAVYGSAGSVFTGQEVHDGACAMVVAGQDAAACPVVVPVVPYVVPEVPDFPAPPV